MKKIINGVLFDTSLSKRIIEVDALIGNRILYQTKRGNFFTLEQGYTILPMKKSEALEFMRISQQRIDPVKFAQILNTYFGVSGKEHDPLKNAARIIGTGEETLFMTYPGRQFYLVTGEKAGIISESQAIEWLEKVQESLDEKEFSNALKEHFITIKTA